MRWNCTVELVCDPEPVQRPDGTWGTGPEVRTEVFCNRWATALDTTSSPDRGLIESAEVQMRFTDYAGQQRAVLDGLEYQVVGVSRDGEAVRVRLERTIANV